MATWHDKSGSNESGGVFAGCVFGIGPKGGCGALEFSGLRVETLPEGNPQKLQMQPLGHESCGNGGSDTPRGYVGHGKVLSQGFGEELHHGPGDAADLHPALQNGAFLLPEIIDAPPAFEVVEDGLDLPSVAVERDDFAGGQMRL